MKPALVGFVCGKYLKIVSLVYFMALHWMSPRSKNVCDLILKKRRDGCVEIQCNSFRAYFKGRSKM